MDTKFWNDRYLQHNSVYGEAPNRFFKSFIDTHRPGSVLLPAEGEGRNALYAARKGWQVDAFDFSPVAKEKALKKAAQKGLSIHYNLLRIEAFRANRLYDAVGLIFIHLPAPLRKRFHEEIYRSLKPGGYLVLEAFAKEQIHLESGGPKDAALLYDAPSLCSDFQMLHLLTCGQKEVQLSEGSFHSGKAHVLQMVGQKL